jgi:hypothetical protein
VRHLYGTALASVMALVMFFGGAWGYLELLKPPVSPGDPGALPANGGSLLSNGSVLLALGVLAVTGVLGGVLVAVPRISPLAAGLPGLLLIGWTVLFLVSVRWATAFIPLRYHSFGAGWEALLFDGVLGAAGLVMVVPLFIPSRWRGEWRSRRPHGRSDASEHDMREPARVTGLVGSAAGPGGTAGPFQAARRPATGPIRTTSPIPTTGPIRLNPPAER